jgi:hypothetical protein
MGRIPYSSVEEQLEARGMTEGEFKEGAVLAYRHLAEELFSSPLTANEKARAAAGVSADDSSHQDRSCKGEGEGEGEDKDEAFAGAEGMIDEHLLRAFRRQRQTFASLGWEPRVDIRFLRVTPQTVVVAPTQQLQWSDQRRPDGSRPAQWATNVARVWAVFRGLYSAATGRGDSFCYLLDCHVEVEEDFQLLDR